MSISIIKTLKSKKVEARPLKIKRRELTPDKLEICLNKSSSGNVGISVGLEFLGKNEFGTVSRRVNAPIDTPSVKTLEEIEELYNIYSKKLEKGEHTFYVEYDGKAEIEWN